MIAEPVSTLRALPSVDTVLHTDSARLAVEQFGRPATVAAVRQALEVARSAMRRGSDARAGADDIAAIAFATLSSQAQPTLRPVFNLTGTVLHTNLGRALIAEAAIEAAVRVMRAPIGLEFDFDTGQRGERDDHLRELLRMLTGAEDATVVNNNAAAVLLVLNTLAKGREAVVSRGELIEIGGAFRMPDIMTRAGAKLVEVGTTNRTHRSDYAAAIGPKTGLVLKVHTSNYRIAGFVAEVHARELVALTRANGVPLINDLGSGTLVDLARFGLPHEPTVVEAVAEGADIVTFSGDKLLGGPQAGFIVGRKDLIAKINRNPMKRALRLDKIRLAALDATLQLYRDPDRLVERLPTLRLLTRPKSEVEAIARRLKPLIAAKLANAFETEVIACASQIGSGALPLENIPSAGLAISARTARRASQDLKRLAVALRRLSTPVIGRVQDGRLILDLRCLDDETGFVANLDALDLGGADAMA
jgi:L-seryl-tRNA(Ser) seleniumtransferase